MFYVLHKCICVTDIGAEHSFQVRWGLRLIPTAIQCRQAKVEVQSLRSQSILLFCSGGLQQGWALCASVPNYIKAIQAG